MILTFFAWLYIFLLTAALGTILVYGWARIRQESLPSLPVYLLSLLGFGVLTILLGFYSLLAPIGASTHLLLTTGVLAFVFCWPAPFRAIWQKWHCPPRLPLFAGCLLGAVYILGMLYWSTTLPTNDDTGLYHGQTIKWLENFAVVPGLGNLHGRLAFNSAFFQWSALFSFSFLTGQPLFPLNGYFFLLVLAAFLPPVLQNYKQAQPGNLLTAILFFLHYDFFPSWISSPTPDIAAMLLIVLINHLVISQQARTALSPAPFHVFTILLLVLTCMTVKLSTLPIIGLVGYLWYAKSTELKPRHLFYMSLVLALVLGPWLMRNILQTGYFIYPFPVLDIWSLDWKIPLETVILEKNIIHGSARMLGVEWQRGLALRFWDWLPIWFQLHSWFFKIILVAAAASPAAMLGYLLVKLPAYPPLHLKKRQVLLWSVYYCGFLFWFINAPSIRFGSAFLHLSWLLPLYWWCLPGIKRYKSFLQALLLVGLIALGLERLRDPLYLVQHRRPVMQQRAWLPEPLPQVALRQVLVHQGQVAVPVQDVFCWYSPLPCTYQVQKKLAFRGKKLEDGFRILKKPAPAKK